MTEHAGEGWLLHFRGGLRAAIGLREMLYVLTNELDTHQIPRAPAHASRVVIWEQEVVPLVDLSVVVGRTESSSHNMIGIVACANDEAHTPAHTRLGALVMTRPPERIRVSDSQACDLPADLPAWRSIATSCFHHPLHGPVPILDLSTILGSQGLPPAWRVVDNPASC